MFYQALLTTNNKDEKEIKKDFFLLQRTRLVNFYLESLPNCLYNAFFTTFLNHDLSEDLDLLQEIVKDTMTTMSSQCRHTITPQFKLNLVVASWSMSCKATT
jgi:hypothetical protein